MLKKKKKKSTQLLRKLALKGIIHIYIFVYTCEEERNWPWLIKLWKKIHPHNSQKIVNKENVKNETISKI